MRNVIDQRGKYHYNNILESSVWLALYVSTTFPVLSNSFQIVHNNINFLLVFVKAKLTRTSYSIKNC